MYSTKYKNTLLHFHDIVVAKTRHNVTFYEHCQSFYLATWALPIHNEAAVVDCRMSIMDYRQVSFYTGDMFLKNVPQIKHKIPISTVYFLELGN